jgi:hypothetical protein
MQVGQVNAAADNLSSGESAGENPAVCGVLFLCWRLCRVLHFFFLYNLELWGCCESPADWAEPKRPKFQNFHAQSTPLSYDASAMSRSRLKSWRSLTMQTKYKIAILTRVNFRAVPSCCKSWSSTTSTYYRHQCNLHTHILHLIHGLDRLGYG